MKRVVWCATGLAVLAGASCGKGSKLYPVSGSVTYHNHPAGGATVFFVRSGGSAMEDQLIMGLVQDDGSFTLVCGPSAQGVPAGEYDVLIEWRQRADPAKGQTQKKSDRLKGRYANPRHPRFHAVVEPKMNHLEPFELLDIEPRELRERGAGDRISGPVLMSVR